jgi:hypothetical protein
MGVRALTFAIVSTTVDFLVVVTPSIVEEPFG